MSGQFRRLSFDEIGLHVLNDPVAHCGRQEIDNRCVNFRWRGERPAFDPIACYNLCNLIGKLFVNTSVGFGFQLRPFRDRIRMSSTRAVAYRKPSGEVTYLVDQFPVRIGDIESLHQLQARPARRRLIHPICF